jgi:hypothetical protein
MEHVVFANHLQQVEFESVLIDGLTYRIWSSALVIDIL